MASKTFLVALLFAAKAILHYVSKHRTKIETNLGETGAALLHALEAAAQTLVLFLETGDYPASDEVQGIGA